MSYLTAVGTATPPFQLPQARIADFMVAAMDLSEDEAGRLRTLFRASGIDTRYSVLEEYGRTTDFEFYADSKNGGLFPGTRERLNLYRQHAPNLSVEAARKCLAQRPIKAEAITHLVLVSCTGMYAPGLDLDLMHQLGLPSTVQRTSITFMGCYAAFNALKTANYICRADPAARVLVVCTELCSIHFQRDHSDDNFLANALFADGAAAALIESKPAHGISLSLENFHCDVAPEGNADMTWDIGNTGFEMRLSTRVPDVIRDNIMRLTQTLLRQVGTADYYAIHPGGRRILEVIGEALHLEKQQYQVSREILREYGNMSSATVLFVLQRLWRSLTDADDKKTILSVAFGPGLTLESMLLRIVTSH